MTNSVEHSAIKPYRIGDEIPWSSMKDITVREKVFQTRYTFLKKAILNDSYSNHSWHHNQIQKLSSKFSMTLEIIVVQ